MYSKQGQSIDLSVCLKEEGKKDVTFGELYPEPLQQILRAWGDWARPYLGGPESELAMPAPARKAKLPRLELELDENSFPILPQDIKGRRLTANQMNQAWRDFLLIHWSMLTLFIAILLLHITLSFQEWQLVSGSALSHGQISSLYGRRSFLKAFTARHFPL